MMFIQNVIVELREHNILHFANIRGMLFNHFLYSNQLCIVTIMAPKPLEPRGMEGNIADS